MAKFNSANTIKTVNKDGHAAYRMTSKSKLVTQVLSSFINEKKFYGDNTAEMQETIKTVIKIDPGFVSKLAVFARREFNMRSVAHVLTAYLAHESNGKPFVRNTVKGIALRGDDVTEVMACYLSMFGKPVPNSLKKGIGDVLNTFDEYTLAKYKGDGKSVKMSDLIQICHPVPNSKKQSYLFKKCLEGTLAIPETWETEISKNGNKAEAWEKLIEDGKLNYMAGLRNLKNLINAEPKNIGKVYSMIENPKAVIKSRQLPFRFLSAYKTVANMSKSSSRVFDVLENAVNASVDNLPKIPGRTVIAIDTSGSMSSTISNRSEIRCAEIAMLIGVIANRICEDAIVYTFDTGIRKLNVSGKNGIIYTAVRESRCGGGTDMALPFQKMIHDRINADRVIIISDNMCNSGSTSWSNRPVQIVADEYRRITNNDIWVHAIDLMGYGTQQFHGPKTNIIAGWSEKVFDFILLAEQGEGTLESKISNYSW